MAKKHMEQFSLVLVHPFDSFLKMISCESHNLQMYNIYSIDPPFEFNLEECLPTHCKGVTLSVYKIMLSA